MSIPKSPVRELVERTRTRVNELKKPDGSPIFASVGFPSAQGFQSLQLPYALLTITGHQCDTAIIIEYDPQQIVDIMDALLMTQCIAWTGTPRFYQEGGKVYCTIAFDLKRETES